MTYIQPSKKRLINTILIWLIAASVFGVLALVVLYNGIVDTEYKISEMRKEIKQIQAEGASLQEKIFSLFEEKNFRGVVENGLIQDKNPEYLKISPVAAAY